MVGLLTLEQEGRLHKSIQLHTKMVGLLTLEQEGRLHKSIQLHTKMHKITYSTSFWFATCRGQTDVLWSQSRTLYEQGREHNFVNT